MTRKTYRFVHKYIIIHITYVHVYTYRHYAYPSIHMCVKGVTVSMYLYKFILTYLCMYVGV